MQVEKDRSSDTHLSHFTVCFPCCSWTSACRWKVCFTLNANPALPDTLDVLHCCRNTTQYNTVLYSVLTSVGRNAATRIRLADSWFEHWSMTGKWVISKEIERRHPESVRSRAEIWKLQHQRKVEERRKKRRAPSRFPERLVFCVQWRSSPQNLHQYRGKHDTLLNSSSRRTKASEHQSTPAISSLG